MPDYKRHGARYRARRRAVDIFFEAEARDIDPVAVVEDRVELSRDPGNAVAPVADYTREIVAGAAEKLDDLDDAIERNLVGDWELHRIPAVDRQILRVAIWEILFNDEVDAPISIKEGVEMASEYSASEAAPYINAVLDAVANQSLADAPFAGEDADDAFQVDSLEVAKEPLDEGLVLLDDPLSATDAEQDRVAEREEAAEQAEIAESTEDITAGEESAQN